MKAWREALPSHLEQLTRRDMTYFHLYAFNMPRQLGANFEMLGTYLQWLGANGVTGLDDAAAACRRIAEGATEQAMHLLVPRERNKSGA